MTLRSTLAQLRREPDEPARSRITGLPPVPILGGMGLLARLFAPTVTRTLAPQPKAADRLRWSPPPAPFSIPATWLQMPTLRGGDLVDVVGESFHQDNLERVTGGRTENGAAVRLLTAQLVREPNNPHDPGAVRVDIANLPVGHISRYDAPDYHDVLRKLAAMERPATCRAWITGGWDRGGRDRGSFGVQLDLDPALIWPEVVMLPAGGQVSVTGEEHAQVLLGGLLGRRQSAETVATLGDPAAERIEVRFGDELVGRLTPAMSERYRPWVTEVLTAGFETTCHAFVAPGPKKIEAYLLLAKP